MSDPRTEIARIIEGLSYRKMIEIAESMRDFSDGGAGVFGDTGQTLDVAEFLSEWAKAVLEGEEEQAKEAGE